jgi:hypothetical protein
VLPDVGLRINLFNVNFIEDTKDGIAIHFNDESCPEAVKGEPAERIKTFWDGVAETLSPDSETDPVDGRDFELGATEDASEPAAQDDA